MEHNQKFLTIFQKSEISEPALFSPSDTTKKIDNFPEICIFMHIPQNLRIRSEGTERHSALN